MVVSLTLPQLILAALMGGALLILGIANSFTWAIALAMLGAKGGAAFSGYLFWGMVEGAAGAALLALAARLPTGRGH